MKNQLLLCIAVSLHLLIGCNNSRSGEMTGDNGREPLTLTVDLEDRRQQIEGFGASDAWSVRFVGRNWPREKRENIAEWLFSSEKGANGNPEGIGLSIWRFNIGAGSARQGEGSGIDDPWRRAESFLKADSTYDWDRQQGQQWFMEEASGRGVEQFVGFVNSPPVLLTKTGKAYGDGSGEANIDEAHYDDFADYLARIAQYFKSEGMPFTYISPVNEPQWDWSKDNGQEGSPYRNEQISKVVQALDGKLQEYGMESKIEIPETAQLDYLYDGDLPGRSNQIEYFFGTDSEVADLPALARKMAAHSYFTTWPVSEMVEQRRKVREAIQNSETPVDYWMSEYCILADNEEIQGNGRDLGMDPALYVARVIHFDMTIAEAASWQWWLAVSPYDYKDGLVYIDKDTEDGEAYDSKLLWGLGNYSHFIRPGAVRLGLVRSDNAAPEEAAPEVMASAYIQDEQRQLTAVLINYSDSDKQVRIDLENTGDRKLEPFRTYLTSAEADLKAQETIQADKTLEVPARSILTLQADYED